MTSTTTTRKPAGAKKPADHQPKAEKPTVKKVDGAREFTHKGFTVTVPDNAFDDFELLDDLRAVQVDQEAQRFPGLLRRLVGEDGYRTVMNGLRDADTGRVSIDSGVEYVGALFEAIAPN